MQSPEQGFSPALNPSLDEMATAQSFQRSSRECPTDCSLCGFAYIQYPFSLSP